MRWRTLIHLILRLLLLHLLRDIKWHNSNHSSCVPIDHGLASKGKCGICPVGCPPPTQFLYNLGWAAWAHGSTTSSHAIETSRVHIWWRRCILQHHVDHVHAAGFDGK